jgi:hypothetical protein
MTTLMATLVVEYGCTRSCQVEFDLTDVHAKYTHGQMLRTVESAHLKAHEREAVKVCTPIPDVTVRAVAR